MRPDRTEQNETQEPRIKKEKVEQKIYMYISCRVNSVGFLKGITKIDSQHYDRS